jgi:hypothetical protein
MPTHIHLITRNRSIALDQLRIEVITSLAGTFDLKTDDDRLIERAITDQFNASLPLGYTWYGSLDDAPDDGMIVMGPHDASEQHDMGMISFGLEFIDAIVDGATAKAARTIRNS